MNARHPFPEQPPSGPPVEQPSAPAADPASMSAEVPPRHLHRPRDFGIGYGNSSGYASARRYTPDWGNARFRVA